MSNYVPVECVVIHATKEAVQVALADDPRDHVWVPFPVIHEEDLDEVTGGQTGEIIEINVAEWFARKKVLA